MSPKVKNGLIIFAVLVVLGAIFGNKDKTDTAKTETAIAQNKYIEEFNKIKKVSVVAVNGTKFNLRITKSDNIFKLHMDTVYIQKVIGLDKSAKVKLDKNGRSHFEFIMGIKIFCSFIEFINCRG